MLRPEMELFKSQLALQGKQYDLIRSKASPKASAFVQGGYGRPGLNMLQNTFDWYGIGGIRFNWMIGNLYTSSNEKQMAAIALKSIKLQEETFLKNSSAQVAQQLIEMSKLKKLMAADKEIIVLRESVKTAAAAQLEAGVITGNDYLREVNAEDQSRQMLTAHEIQLVQAEIQLKLITGKK
jgi:outer membrane protein TolC